MTSSFRILVSCGFSGPIPETIGSLQQLSVFILREYMDLLLGTVLMIVRKASGTCGISVVGRNYYGVFPLRGKLLNVREASHKQIMENAEIQSIKQILGLQHGKQYDSNVGGHYETWNTGVLGPVALCGLDQGKWDLSWAKWTYQQNNPSEICLQMREKGYASRIVVQRSTEEESLHVIKFWRDFDSQPVGNEMGTVNKIVPAGVIESLLSQVPGLSFWRYGNSNSRWYTKSVNLCERDTEMPRKLMRILKKLREEDPAYYQLCHLVRHSEQPREVIADEGDPKSSEELFTESGNEKSVDNLIPKSETDFLEYANLISQKLHQYERCLTSLLL
ncbi:unnamed protein product [Camellia sinensis]